MVTWARGPHNRDNPAARLLAPRPGWGVTVGSRPDGRHRNRECHLSGADDEPTGFEGRERVMDSSQRLGAARVQLGLRVVGAGLLAATGAIHLDLYLTGFRHIPTIGWLFLLQVIAAFGLAVLQLVPGGRLMAALGAGFAVATLGGYLLSIWFGLFGFHEVRTTAGIVAGLIEVATFAVLGMVALTPAAPARA